MNVAQGPFGNCKEAVLQRIGTVQANGVLVAIDSQNHVIEYCSANCAELLGIAPAELLGRTGSQWLGQRWPALLSMVASQDGSLESGSFAGTGPLTVVAHRCGSHLIFEFEALVPPPQSWWNHAKRIRFLEQLTGIHTAEACGEFLIRWVFELAGYDRVLMYRFLPDWDGEVIGERCRPGIQGFLGLRFPASDIPPNARQMFALNWQRAIADVDSQPSPILRENEGAHPIDLTYSTLRSAHPVHIQYLRNMGVLASITLSMVVNGKLWGLITCHHLSPRRLSIENRLAFEEMARFLSLHLRNLLAVGEQDMHSHMRQQLSRLEGAMSAEKDDLRVALSHNLASVRQMFGASGAWLRYQGEDFFVGLVPDKLSLSPLRDYFERFARSDVSHFDTLPAALHPYRALAANASGILFIPLGSADFLALMRPEIIATVNWAGKPAHLEDSPDTERALTPRHSFAVWSQRVRHTAEPWTPIDLEFGAKLRTNVQLFLSTARLEQIALHDALTGLANRHLFEKRLQQEVRNSMARDTTFAVHMIDLDRFKQVNDTLGHGAGDQVLKQVAIRLTKLMRQGDTVARLGGDEFAIIQTGLDDTTWARSTADKIVKAVSEEFHINGQPVEIGASVGVSLCPADTAEESELLEYADLALYRVKHSGRNASSLYDPSMRSGRTGVDDHAALEQALRNGEFRLHYQPLIDARSGNLRSLEAFLRWCKQDGTEIPASQFMAMVDKKRMAPALTEWVMEEVFRQYQHWMREGMPTVPIAINIDSAEFATQDLLGRIESTAGRYGTGWQWLQLDIKEQALVYDIGQAIRKLNSLREAGVSANLDNFGCGFVPLGYLTQLPFRGIKIDSMLFEQESDHHSFSALFNIVQSISQVLSAQLTVTRIETREMAATLRREHIDLLQGHAIARPAHAAAAAAWLLEPGSLWNQTARLAPNNHSATTGDLVVHNTLERI